MAIGINSRENAAARSEKSDSVFPEQPHTKHKPTAGPSASSDHRVLSSEAVGSGHQDAEGRLTDFGGWPEDEPCGSGPSGEGIDGTGHVLGKRSSLSE